MRRILLIALAVPLACLVLPDSAQAQVADPQILLVPDAPKNPRLPHPVYETAPITLKGILRNANCGNGYSVRWDVDRDGDYNDDAERIVTPTGGSVYDIGRTFTVPQVNGDTSLPINVRVVNRCNNQQAFATYRLFVYDWAPSNNPEQWSDEQLEIMGKVALSEALWKIHRGASNFGGSGPTIEARHIGSGRWVEGTALAVWAFTINGHLPAYPPDQINANNFRGWNSLPDGWVDENAQRWEASPYSETAMRFSNRVLLQGTGWQNISPGDEANSCGFDRNGNERNCAPIPGTDNNRGAYTGGHSNNTYRQGIFTGAFPTVLPSLAGTQLQVGGLAGLSYEAFAQELTDWLGYMQIDSGCGAGGWYYSAQNGSPGCSRMDSSTAQWGYIGLESAEIAGAPYGVIVSNAHKYKLGHNVVRNQHAAGGSAYRTGSGSHAPNTQLTGGAFVAARWLGIHQFAANDNSRPFAPYSQYTAGEMRQAYDRYVAFTNNWWNVDNGDWWGAKRFWRNGTYDRGGSYLCGNRNAVYRWGGAAECGNLYAIYSHQKGYRTGQPEQGNIGNHDWQREFTTYVTRSQYRSANDYGNFGLIKDCDTARSIVCWAGYTFSTPVGALVLTPTIFNPKPVAIGTAEPTTVAEGCAGGNNGIVRFDHSESFHPNPEQRIIAYRWDVDASNGLWWETGAPADYIGGADAVNEVFEYTYQRRGDYTATMQVVGSGGQTKSTSVSITVNPSANKGPSATHGGPYVIEIGDDLDLRGTATDANLGCGDRLTVGWDLDGDGAYDDEGAADGVVPWARIQNLPVGEARRIAIRVSDSAGLVATANTTVTIYPREPIAQMVINPDPAACRQAVTFDATQTRHPNPNRQIAEYQWDVDGNDGFDGGGAVFEYTYARFGTYSGRLLVTDDRGRTDEVEFDLAVNQGNAAPVARIAEGLTTVLEDSDLVLDARGSTDANLNCGDRIVEYAFDINGDGDFNDAVDVRGPAGQITVPWATLAQAMDWPADRQTGRPENVVTVRVTDTFGQSSSVQTRVRIFRARPEARFDQLPDPAYVNGITGRSDVTLDARASFSPVPDGQIERYQWDTDGDGVFGDLPEEPSVLWRLVFDPVPQAGQQPERVVTLRVTDSNGQRAEVTQPVRFATGPVPPTADADPTDPPEQGYHLLDGDPLTLSAQQSFDPNEEDSDDYLRFYRWALAVDDPDADELVWDVVVEDRNGDEEEATAIIAPAALRAAGVDGPGEYTVVLEVEDTTGRTSRDMAILAVYDRAPEVRVAATPNPGACAQRVNLDASQSSHPHPGVDVVEWLWDYDEDGVFDDAEGPQVSLTPERFTFGEPRTIRVRVTDSAGDTSVGELALPVTEGNRAPAVDAGGPYIIAPGDGVALDGRDSSEPDADCGDAVVNYAWDIDNNGQSDVGGADEALVELTWAQLGQYGIDGPGQYPVRLTVTDRFGRTASAGVVVQVVNGPTAVAEIDPARAGCNALVTFDGSRSFTDGPIERGFEIVDWSWDFDRDGDEDANGRAVQRNAVGTDAIEVRLTVTDAGGRTDSVDATLEIVIDNVPPVANAGGPYVTGPLGGGQFAPIDLDARGSNDPNAPCDEIVRYEWDTDGDGLYGESDRNGAGNRQGSDYTGAVIRDYTSPAWQVGLSQLVRVRACDLQGLCSPAGEADVEVLDTAPPVGEIISPRIGECIGDDVVEVAIRVRDADGDRVTAVLTADGVELARAQIQTRADNQPVDHTFQVAAADLPEGNRLLEVEFTDANDAVSTADSGGRVTFDRTAPQVTIANNLGEGVCYPANGVPERRVTVEDALDPGPAVDEAIVADGCQRTLTVTATDACGNATEASRSYLLAQPVDIELDGPDENALVAEARYEWSVVGPEACAGRITARLSQDGAGGVVYAANTPIDTPGNYTLRVDVPDCDGNARQVLRAFQVNGSPIAVPVPDGHPLADRAAGGPTYVVDEGSVLEVDGGESRPPEAGDNIAAWAWDFDEDGAFETEGRTARFPTNDDGIFGARLRVTDSLGAVDVEAFEVRVLDVDPVADAGGNYTVRQGEVFTLDGSNSRPGSGADPITRYIWTLPDGAVVADGAGASQPETSFDVDQTIEVTLEVRDEDSADRQTVQVTVRDVSPEIGAIRLPEDPVELKYLPFEVVATPGAELDPIIAYEWDFDSDGQADVTSPEPRIEFQFTQPGDYHVTLRLRDPDSSTTTEFDIEVRGITYVDLLEDAQRRADEVLDDPDTSARVRSALEPQNALRFDELVERGMWAERNERRSETLVALDEIGFRIYRAQGAGADFGDYLWVVSQVLLRDLDGQWDEVDALDIDNAALTLSDDSKRFGRTALDRAHEIFGDAEYRDRSISEDEAYVARDFMAAAMEAWFWFAEARHPNQSFNGFPVPSGGTVASKIRRSEPVNQDLAVALARMADELEQYVAAGGEGDPGPGREQIEAALGDLAVIQGLVAIPVFCDQNPPDGQEPLCITDRQSLDLQLKLMDLIANLFAAADRGVYVRGWQNLLTLAVKFRVELALLRIESVCGPNMPLTLAGREQQAILLDMVDAGRNELALQFYVSPERRCLVVQEYNECLVPAIPDENRPVDYPENCEPGVPVVGEAPDDPDDPGAGDGPVFLGDQPIPMPQPFDDILMLRDILQANQDRIDVSDAQTREENFPNRSFEDFDTDEDGDFDLQDVDLAILMYLTDLTDDDNDTLPGVIENRCVIGERRLDPRNPQTTGQPDVTMDCDGDRISNGVEMQLHMNPLDPRDADLDYDGDGIPNRMEIESDLDLLDPADGEADADGDGVTNAAELLAGLDMNNAADAGADFDLDGISNGVEATYGMDPRDPADADADLDGDGMSSRNEIARGRHPLRADCANDPAELDARNDSADEATELEINGRVVVGNGTLCNSADANDADFYGFNVPERDMRLVVTLSHPAGVNLNLRLFRADTGAQVGDSSTAFQTELVSVPRGQLRQGDYVVRVSSPEGDEADYELVVTLVPGDGPCTPDAWEGAQGNDRQAAAVAVGTPFRVGEAWICEDERRAGDWFGFDVTDTDKTVHITYTRSDGIMQLAAMNTDLSAFIDSAEVNTSVQCINVEATGNRTPVFVNVTASTIFSDGDSRADYVLQIVDTDLRANPRGACDALSNGLFDFVQWPLLRP